jgi:hypothetical protein
MKQLLVSCIVLLLLAGSASSIGTPPSNYSYSGAGSGFVYQLYDFGSSSSLFDHNNNYSPIEYPYGIGNSPSPSTASEGGELYDLEGLNVAVDDEYVYLSLANSFGFSAYSSAFGQAYEMGDLFIYSGDGSSTCAIDITSSGAAGLYEVSSAVGIPDIAGSYYGSSYAAMAGDYQIGSGSKLGDIESSLTRWNDLESNFLAPGNGDTWVYEFKFSRALLGDFTSLSFHATLGCGNDKLTDSYSSVPEPATLLLFTLGAAGIGFARRRRK